MLQPTVTRILVLSLLLKLLEAAQIPLGAHQHSTTFNEDVNWDLNKPPGENATGHLVFETVNSFMQHWPNTRYRNGHNIVPGIVPPGTVLYHGRGDSNTPTSPEWLATDPEHSFMFCRGQTADSGCWQLTVTATRPLKVLYFDGSAAAKMPDGAMDSQDILAYGKVVPDKYRGERERIRNLCEWAKNLDVDGFVRMEMDFEIMLCDFTEGVLVEAVNLRARPRGRPGPGPGGPGRGPKGPGGPSRHLDGIHPPPEIPPHRYNTLNQTLFNSSMLPDSSSGTFFPGSWHRYYPGDTRIQLDLTRLISFYDTELVPSLVSERYGKERIKHRLLGISPEDLQTVVRKIEQLTKVSEPGSGVDWATLIRLIVKRYSERLEMVQYMLNSTDSAKSASENKVLAETVQVQLIAMLQPYLLSNVKPPQDPTSTEWVSPVYKLCTTTYTSYITTSSLHSRLTPSEELILNGIHETTKEICRVVTGMWVDGMMAGLEPDFYKPSTTEDDDFQLLLDSWKERTFGLMKWLDWSVWLECRPACGFEEMCYLPMWPFRGGADESDDPKPRCVRRMASLERPGGF
ncbi:hypothetical protein DFH05DRAFT_1524910 [Lentinula detonsa]|uniref:Uncharacterized protein n=1 Tax=Lentinula detonsa TaxID=2804962 RepID=A0A9W8NZW8_9AGAR|nr:hypothetical protein DFH05DRAFT_1524910 [Lentinula detonsa]